MNMPAHGGVRAQIPALLYCSLTGSQPHLRFLTLAVCVCISGEVLEQEYKCNVQQDSARPGIKSALQLQLQHAVERVTSVRQSYRAELPLSL
jgi:hypothetical protein